MRHSTTSVLDELLNALMHEPVVTHQAVLIREVLQWLAPRPGMRVVDCTVGGGGHSFAMLPHLVPTGSLLAIDRDAQAIANARERLAAFQSHVTFVQDNFRNLPEMLKRAELLHVDGVVADVGISSLQVDKPARGFSFQREGPLDMRMDQRQTTTAAMLLRRVTEQDLAMLIQRYGEERWAKRIAKAIIHARQQHPIETTAELARIVRVAVPRAGGLRIHPATRTFQALRIAVNDELASLEELLAVLPDVLALGGRAIFMTFHSLEDRLVKHAFRRHAQDGRCRILTPKPVRPSEEELAANPRSRSAKLRVLERCA